MGQLQVKNKITPEYDFLVGLRDDLSPCYAPYYLRLLCYYLKTRRVLLIFSEGGTPLGVLAFLVKDGPEGRVANSMPYYGSYGGCVVAPSLSKREQRQVKEKLLQGALQWAREDNIRLLTIINHPFEEDPDLYEEVLKPTFQDVRIGQVLRLPKKESMEEALNELLKMHRKNRNVVRKGIRLTQVRAETAEDAFNFLYRTHAENMRAIGGTPKEWAFFDIVRGQLEPDSHYRLYVGYVEGKRAAACLTFRYGKVIDYFTPAIDQRFRSTQALSGVIVKAMQEGTIDGFTWWNWGGTWLSQTGVYRFKARWGGEDRYYKYHIKGLGDLEHFVKLGRKGLLTFYRHFYTLPFDKVCL
ncbi:MAG: hypothetical protein DRH12_10140 [Deltaproteobacteria bacterium]|nr:MAG: hypothetical protein DRH12_10140 [Deltaproteobacteria bacterium]